MLVWRAELCQDGRTLRRLRDSLSPDELRRANGFHFRRDCERFVAARAALRDALSRYVGVAPRPLCFSCDNYGKPSLRDEAGRARLRFNASHSNGLALYAVTPGRQVGVDLEFVREEFAGGSYRAALAVEGAPTALRCRRRPGGVR
ncbi:MAG: hypothetical protein M3348_15905 [Acidobacteriota bacterium]|nr:hypothetical protein [Acidobacteriota bacterium]